MSTALYKALRAADVPDDLAERAAESIPAEAATKADLISLEADLTALEARLVERIYRAAAVVVIVNAAVVSAAAGVIALL